MVMALGEAGIEPARSIRRQQPIGLPRGSANHSTISHSGLWPFIGGSDEVHGLGLQQAIAAIEEVLQAGGLHQLQAGLLQLAG